MANRWNIPAALETMIRLRDQTCVYCRRPFTPYSQSRKMAASWEHIINDASLITPENIALCCCGCNASKGQKPLLLWLASPYCARHGITAATVAPVVQLAIIAGA